MANRPSSDRFLDGHPATAEATSVDDDRLPSEELERLVRARTAQLEEAQRRTAAALDSVNEGFVILDRDWRFVFANAAAERFILKSRAELLGKGQWELFPEASHRRFGTEYRRAVAEGVPVHFEEFYPEPLNRWFEVRAYPSAEGLSIFFSDITERKRFQRDLELARLEAVADSRRLEAVMDALPVGVAIVDAQGGNVRSNRAYDDIWRGPRPTARSVADYAAYKAWWMDTGRPVEPEEWASARAVRSGETVVGQAMQIERFDGTRAFVLNSAAPVFDAAGAIVGSAVAIQDITGRVESDRALAASEAALQTANEQLHSVNAELRSRNETLEERVLARTADLTYRTTQLRALAGELARAEERERRRVAQVIHDHLQQLLVVAQMNVGIVGSQTRNASIKKDLKQVDDVIAEALVTARTLTAELSPAVLYRSGLPAALGWLSRWYHDKYGITVELEADQDAGVQPEEVRITLYRSVSELLFNAVKHAHTKVVHVRLSQTVDGRIRIVVSDAGVGFDPQEARAREGFEGGFGLFNLRERLESLGGALEVESEPGCGTRVTVIGPRLAPSSAEARSGKPVSRPASGRRESAGGRRAIRILLVDDHAIVRDGLIRAFRNARGLEVVGQAANGRQAVDEARRLKPDVVLMDVAMPGMDGIEATRALRAELPDVKIIGLSMFDDETHGAEMRSAGAVAFVHKTAPAAVIVRAIREHAAVPPSPARGSGAPRPPRGSRAPKRT